MRALARHDALEDLRRPRRAFAALRALRAALVGEEARERARSASPCSARRRSRSRRRSRASCPARRSPRSPSSVASASSIVWIGTEMPPGMIALNLRPGSGPPQRSYRKSLNGKPIGDFVVAGPLRCCRTPRRASCRCSSGCRRAPNFLYQSAPLFRMCGTAASVSTLLIVVGWPNTPATAGNGGLMRGLPRRPSSEFISAVSSPQMYAPAPLCTWTSTRLAGAHRVLAEDAGGVRFLDAPAPSRSSGSVNSPRM